MTRFLAEQHCREWHWTADATWMVIYSITAAGFILAWACLPA
jgi:hypothetical protein